MEVALTKMSSKGQVVIPAEMRKDLPEGEKILLIKNEGRIIMKKAEKDLVEDLVFAKRTEEALKDYEKHPESFIKMSSEKFLKELKKW